MPEIQPRTGGGLGGGRSFLTASILLSAVLYCCTALLGVWAAYDRPVALGRLALLMVGLALALIICWVGRLAGERGLALLGLACALLAGAVACYFILTYDWQKSSLIKLPFLYAAGRWIQSHRPGLPVSEDIHTNVAAGALIVLVSLGAGGVIYARRHRWPSPISAAGLAALAAGVTALVLTMSRGAWLGLGAGCVVAATLATRQSSPHAGLLETKDRPGKTRLLDGLLLLAGLLVGVLLLLGLAPPAALQFVGDASAASRPQMWRWALDIIGDQPFTGSGLGSTMMVLSTYVLMLHVGFTNHVHNLFLQIAVEQGLPGLIAFLAMAGVAIVSLRRSFIARGPTPMMVCAAAALTAMLIHGLVDSGLHMSRLAPLAFLPFGFAWGLPSSPPVWRPSPALRIAALGTGVLLLVALLLPPTRAAVLTNLGAVAQTRAELSYYVWPQTPIQDALRRSKDVDLEPAISYYRAALALAPGLPSANRRLGQVELSQGDTEAAGKHLLAAYRAAPDQWATRFLLGEAEAVSGRIDQAVALWSTLDREAWRDTEGVGRLAFGLRSWWYGAINEPEKAQWLTEVLRRVEAARPVKRH